MKKYCYLFAAAVPFIVMCAFLLDTASDSLTRVQWPLIPFLEKWRIGALTLRDLLSQEGEHRIFFPRLIMLSLAAVTHWNIYYEIALNFLMGTCVFAVLFRQIRKMEILFGPQPGAVYFLVSFFSFSLAQSENWLCGYNSIVWLNVLCCVAGFFLLASPEFGLKKFLLAAAAGIVALYSYGSGILFWGFGFLILCARPLAKKKAALTAWAALAAFAAAGYLWGYQKPPQHPSLLFALSHPLQAAGYFLVFFGSPVLPFAKFIALVGFFGLFCLAAFIFTAYHACRLLRGNNAGMFMILPWLALASYSIVSGAMATAARVWFGIAHATQTHYVTIANLLWIALIVLTPVAARSFMQPRPGFLPGIARNRGLQYVCLIMFCALQISVAKHKWVWEKTFKGEKERINGELLAGNYDEALKSRLVPPDVRELSAVLKKYRLAMFRGEGAAAKQPLMRHENSPAGTAGAR